ncbi:DUF1206 domain-containing protein [Humibacter sp.]|uniref:DUF1206 domain-containing protein n=1 Tax=Humibacter sp. TaxID=1940291 RepID=UPI003F7D5D84
MVHGESHAFDSSDGDNAGEQGGRSDAADAAEAAEEGVKTAAATAEDSTVLRLLTRAGFAVLGVVHILVGASAISLAVGSGGVADQSGAMSQIAHTSGGAVLLWMMVAGLGSLTLWQVAQTVLVWRDGAAKRWGKRGSEAAKGVAYAVIGVSALIFALGGRANSHHTVETLSAGLLQTPAGGLVVVLAGATIFGIGIGFAVIGARRTFRKQLRMPATGWAVAVTSVGLVGYVAKGVALGIVGVFFAVAAVTGDARDAGGLDAALKLLRGLTFGEVLLWVVGLGLIVYGLYCGIRALLAKL